ncbi:hypothetical protein GCM10029978_087080 [Actinoallomurus acanthiterrae]
MPVGEQAPRFTPVKPRSCAVGSPVPRARGLGAHGHPWPPMDHVGDDRFSAFLTNRTWPTIGALSLAPPVAETRPVERRMACAAGNSPHRDPVRKIAMTWRACRMLSVSRESPPGPPSSAVQLPGGPQSSRPPPTQVEEYQASLRLEIFTTSPVCGAWRNLPLPM